MRLEAQVFSDADAAARAAAGFIARRVRENLERQDRFLLALSGGRTPGRMFNHLAAEDLPWPRVHLFQADERAAPTDSEERSLTNLKMNLLMQARHPQPVVHPMPVEMADLDAGARAYAHTLQKFGGTPPVLDMVHLGLGADGHAASLVPGDPVLEVVDADVGLTGVYKGRRRMTLTFPLMDRARCVLWLVTGTEKAEMLRRLCSGDTGMPAGRIDRARAVVFADQAAAAELATRPI